MDPTVRARGRDARTAPLLVAALAVAVVVAASCVAVLLAVQPASARTSHAGLSVADLGTLRGGEHSYAYDTNDGGQVVGYSETASGEDHAVLWEKGRKTDLGTLPGGDYSYAFGINERGQVVGYSEIDSLGPHHGGPYHAFLWEGGKMRDLGTLAGEADAGGLGINSLAHDINDRGRVVGWSATASGESHAFLWRSRQGTDPGRIGGMKDLGTLGGPNSQIHAINEREQAVGHSSVATKPYYPEHAFLWEKGEMTDLGTLDRRYRYSRSLAHDINDRGWVVGESEAHSGRQAFVWEDGNMTALGGTPDGTESGALGINDLGQIVGFWKVYESHEPHAALWHKDKRIDLGALRGGDLSGASEINDRGQIVGWSETASGYTHAVLWSKREPHGWRSRGSATGG